MGLLLARLACVSASHSSIPPERHGPVGVPPRSSVAMSASDEALLLDELLTWKNACLALTPTTALIRHRPAG